MNNLSTDNEWEVEFADSGATSMELPDAQKLKFFYSGGLPTNEYVKDMICENFPFYKERKNNLLILGMQRVSTNVK